MHQQDNEIAGLAQDFPVELHSGAGFGVAEGIMYSTRYYNGMETTGIYWVRFVSCVAMHAVWAGAVGITLFRNRMRFQGVENFWVGLCWTVYIIAVPMVFRYPGVINLNLRTGGICPTA